jgi:magnesium-transporting ATPase (P-type)
MCSESKKWKKVTVWVLVLLTTLVIVYDTFVAFFNSEKGDTISRVIQEVSHNNWSLPFAIGALFVGHFFWYGRPVMSQPWSFIGLVAVFGILLALDIAGITPRVNPLALLGFGAVAGRYLFPMSPIL